MSEQKQVQVKSERLATYSQLRDCLLSSWIRTLINQTMALSLLPLLIPLTTPLHTLQKMQMRRPQPSQCQTTQERVIGLE
jgi:hypothetical protein